MIIYLIETKEKITKEVKTHVPSFFNIFSNFKTPFGVGSTKIDYSQKEELDIIQRLSVEEELHKELTENIIPFAIEYFVGFPHEKELVSEYLSGLLEANADQNEDESTD